MPRMIGKPMQAIPDMVRHVGLQSRRIPPNLISCPNRISHSKPNSMMLSGKQKTMNRSYR